MVAKVLKCRIIAVNKAGDDEPSNTVDGSTVRSNTEGAGKAYLCASVLF